MNLYLLRVGADSTKAGGGFWSHIGPDWTYVFIPIPEKEEKLEKQRAITYEKYKWNNQSVLDYLPRRIRNAPNKYYIHDDPEFQTFTYGSPQLNQNNSIEKNYRALSGMKKGDMLTFYAAFTKNGTDIEGYYFFAYFIVERSIPYDNPADLTKKESLLAAGNHHYIHRLKNQVIVKGCPKQSGFLKKAVLLSSYENDRQRSNYYPCQSIQQKLGGYCKSMNLSSIRRIDLPEKGILQFKQYLDNNSV